MDPNNARSILSSTEDNAKNSLTFTHQLTPTKGLTIDTSEEKEISQTMEQPENHSDSDESLNATFGLSNNLSRESLRRVCGFIEDDLSDNDLIEVQNIPDTFKSKAPSSNKLCLEDIKLCIRRKSAEEIPLYSNDLSADEKILSQSNDALSALDELDAVLDVHDDFACSTSHTEGESVKNNIDDCLLDLDDYLDKMEKSIADYDGNNSSNLSFSSRHPFDHDITPLQRGHNHRMTLGCVSERRSKNNNGNQPLDSALTPVYGTLGGVNRRYSCEEQLKNRNINIDEQYNENTENAAQTQQRTSCGEQCANAGNSSDIQALTEEQIFQNFIEQNTRNSSNDEPRPRQYGRRAERFSHDSMANNEFGMWNPPVNTRPMSAPAIVPLSLLEQPSSMQTCVASDGSTVRSSRNTSPVTIESTTDSSESSGISQTIPEPNINMGDDLTQEALSSPTDIRLETETSQKLGFNNYWPTNYSRTFALVSCTLGLFNICRFAVLSINYGANFLIQFLLLSLIFGIPFFWLQMCLGSKIRSGPVSMWRISPICRGIGISLMLVQYFLATYSSVAIVWLLVYLSDTFMFQQSYRWSDTAQSLFQRNISQTNYTITRSIPDYFNVHVLQRLQFDGKGIRVQISDRLAFYLVILWAMVFLILCKGLKSFGKVILIIGVLPLLTLTIVTGKLLCVVDLKRIQNVFSPIELDDFLINSKTWTAAAQETFLTWGLLGASVIAISSRNVEHHSKLCLRRDAILTVIITMFGLCLSAFMGLCCGEILNRSGFVYVPGSYEQPGYYTSVYSLKSSGNSDIISFPSRFVPHSSSLIGEVYRRQEDVKHVSGYQVLRFVTELFPAVAAIGGDSMSWIWVAVVLIMLFAFGVVQLCAMWKPISCALGNSTSAVLLSCVTGLLLSIPFATEIGIKLLHFFDILLGGAWFIPILWVAQIFGVFLIRGRPYNGDDLVNDLKMSGSVSAFLALSWNVLLPIGLTALAVIDYKVSLSHQMFYWRGRSYYAYWVRKLGALTQIGFLLIVPITAIIQIYRYLTSGPPDILDRIQMLYRPMEGILNNRSISRMNRNGYDARYRQATNGSFNESALPNLQDDAPPKYTPPPSYTTATGARIAKILRQSIRRSVRRLLGSSERSRPILSGQIDQNRDLSTVPPNYSSVLPNATRTMHENTPSISESIDLTNTTNHAAIYGRSLSLGRKRRPFSVPREINQNSNTTSQYTLANRPFTAEDVITILRSSTRCRNESPHSAHPRNQIFFRSIENLVLNAEPLGISSSVTSENITENENNTSVI